MAETFAGIVAPRTTSKAERIASIDVLRGVAVLGILLMNIQLFAMVGSAYKIPTTYGDLTGANYWVWYLTSVLADGKFMAIFAMLFGAGVVLMTGRQEASQGTSAGFHYRRMAILLLFGLLHAYLFWAGDILYSYAMCGFIVYLFRKLPPRRLLLIGILLLAAGSSIYLGLSRLMSFVPDAHLAAFYQSFRPGPVEVARELAVNRAGWLAEFRARVPETLMIQTVVFAIFWSWRAAGLMLIGMGLFRLDVFSAALPRWIYWTMAAVGLGVGIPVVMFGIHKNFAAGWDPRYSVFGGSQYNYWASIFVSLGWAGLVMLACKSPWLGFLTSRFASVGQMALTNYLMQTLICTTIFYGYGLSLYGRMDRVEQILVVAAVWTFQLIVSPIWLSYFNFGPVEWLWRSLTYMKIQPFRAVAKGSELRPAIAPRILRPAVRIEMPVR